MICYFDPIASLIGPWSSQLNVASVLLRIALSVLLAALIGCERASKRHAAGLRTFILVSFAATMAMSLDMALSGGSYIFSAAAIIGVAIISVNSVLFSSKSQIKGLTTSVGLWTCSVLGLCIGAGCYTVAIVAYLALSLSLALFPSIERYLKDRSNHFEFHVELDNPLHLQSFAATIRQLGMRIDDIEINPAYAGSGLSVYSIAISISSQELRKYKTHKQIIEALNTLEYVHHIEEIR